MHSDRLPLPPPSQEIDAEPAELSGPHAAAIVASEWRVRPSPEGSQFQKYICEMLKQPHIGRRPPQWLCPLVHVSTMPLKTTNCSCWLVSPRSRCDHFSGPSPHQDSDLHVSPTRLLSRKLMNEFLPITGGHECSFIVAVWRLRWRFRHLFLFGLS